jgi:hypothetical protein
MFNTQTKTGLTPVITSRKTADPPKTRWIKTRLTTVTAVEQLLDQLEREGYTERELVIDENEFVVRWR